jgi:hypothetical protein
MANVATEPLKAKPRPFDFIPGCGTCNYILDGGGEYQLDPPKNCNGTCDCAGTLQDFEGFALQVFGLMDAIDDTHFVASCLPGSPAESIAVKLRRKFAILKATSLASLEAKVKVLTIIVSLLGVAVLGLLGGLIYALMR